MKKKFIKNLESLKSIFLFIQECAKNHDINSEVIKDIELAVEELFTNLIRHNPKREGEIQLELQVESSKVTVTITDYNADEFDPRQSGEIDINKPLYQRIPGGLGLHITKKVMDDIHYEFSNNVSVIRMIKQLGS